MEQWHYLLFSLWRQQSEIQTTSRLLPCKHRLRDLLPSKGKETSQSWSKVGLFKQAWIRYKKYQLQRIWTPSNKLKRYSFSHGPYLINACVGLLLTRGSRTRQVTRCTHLMTQLRVRAPHGYPSTSTTPGDAASPPRVTFPPGTALTNAGLTAAGSLGTTALPSLKKGEQAAITLASYWAASYLLLSRAAGMLVKDHLLTDTNKQDWRRDGSGTTWNGTHSGSTGRLYPPSSN